MENAQTSYRINSPSIVFEEIDGEAVIVNMQNGSYYSLENSGAFIWSLIGQGMTAAEVLDVVTARYAGPADDMKRAIDRLIEKLLAEEVVVPDRKPREGATASIPDANGVEKIPFERPLLRKYSDMEELLLLDPVHDFESEDSPSASD